MANFAKFTRGDCGLFAHCERMKDANGNYITLGNERIDPEKTYLNYNMCPEGGEQKERLEARLSDPNVKCLNREDVVVYGSWCITLPTQVPMTDANGNIIYEDKEVHHKDGTITRETVPKLEEISYSPEEIKEFFEISYKFLSDRYGEKNVISAYVHMDETTPHMHFLFVPVVPDNKWNDKNPDKVPREKVCAKELMNKTEMSVFHKEFQRYLDAHSQKDLYPVLNGTTIGGSRTIAELKAESALKEANDISKKVKSIKEEAKASIDELIEEYQDWSIKEEAKERVAVKELKESFDVVGLSKEHDQALREFAKALDNPVKGKNGKTYVEVPEPQKLIPFLKTMVQKALKAIDLIKDVTRNTKDKIERAGTSIKDRLADAKARADQHNNLNSRNRFSERSEHIQRKDEQSR
ncbi:MAG: plasmid recombination protein [Lachnospiraceae bacterium]|nr:plasmid recombination protein [Lachnospiraceae bacterium]